MLLGPTEDRVARWLRDRTRVGRITIRTVDLCVALRLERSEAYRITRRLRVLGLFGIENDQGGTKGGRRYWRTAIEHEYGELDAARHRTAWARLTAWAQARAARVRAFTHYTRQVDQLHEPGPLPRPSAALPPAADGPTFAERMRRAGLGELMDAWGLG